MSKSALEALDRAQEIVNRIQSAKRSPTASEKAEIKRLMAEAEREAMIDQMAQLGKSIGFSSGGDLYSAAKSAGWHFADAPAVTLNADVVLGRKAASFDGSIDDLNQIRVDGFPLGADERYLYPALRRVDVDAGVTSIAVLRQKSRTLASTSAMIRDIDETSAKPETATVKELDSVPLKQIASIESGVPNVIAESQSFANVINTDLTLAFRRAVDAHVTATINAANPATTTGGNNLLEMARYGVETITAAGYSPNVIAVSPSDATELDLLKSSGPEENPFFATTARQTNGQPLWGLSIRVVPGLTTPLVLDSRAVGTLHLSPLRFARFEENDGSTNSSTFRAEAHGAFALERVDAVTELAQGS